LKEEFFIGWNVLRTNKKVGIRETFFIQILHPAEEVLREEMIRDAQTSAVVIVLMGGMGVGRKLSARSAVGRKKKEKEGEMKILPVSASL
jgi:hypothetical protein